MRLDIPQGDDAQYFRRTRTPEPPRREQAALIEPGPLDRRIKELEDRAEQRRFPEIPRRQYQQKPVPDAPDLNREPVERQVRSRHHLPAALPGVRLHPEERQLLY